jgi:prepilin-type N-terminal cleavage/methylation domain-containing protein
MKKKFANIQKAYSLIELSIVLVIVSVLVAGAMTISIDNLKGDQILLTKDRMDAIYKRLGHHMRSSRALPCPAPANKVRSIDSDYGAAGNCVAISGGVYASGNFIWGAVPCVTLGLSLDHCEDAFGSKIIYFVDKRFTSAADPSLAPVFAASISDYNYSTMANDQLSGSPSSLWTIKENPTGSAQIITSNAALGMVSLGGNKFGAYNANSSSQNVVSIDPDEQTNYAATTAFISSSSASSIFDDIVFYKTMKDIVKDYPELMALVPCKNVDSDYVGNGLTGHVWFEGVAYSKKHAECAQNQNIRFSKKCVANGLFTNLLISCAASC